MSTGEQLLDRLKSTSLDEVVRGFPTLLSGLQSSFEELEARAERVEDELCETNRELEARVAELGGLKRHLEAVLESLPCGVVVRDAAGAIVDANAAAQRILGMTVEELRANRGHAALKGDAANGEQCEIQSKGGRRLVVSSSYSEIVSTDHKIEGSVEILDDRTERVEMIERLHATDKMAALGTMAAGIAHEIRNPLNAIKGFAGLLRRRDAWDEKSSRWCKLIVDAAAEADSIIESMLSFGSPQRIRQETINGAALVDAAIRLARTEQSDNVTIERIVDVPAFIGDRIKLRQAIRNLVANAIEAQSKSADARVRVQITRDGGDVVVRVSDAGPGINPDDRQRIFDPFFTNRPHGTGLGLALVSTVMRLHEGSVHVSQEPSDLGGAEFLLRIPFQAAPTPPPISHSQEG